jgi:hypothetical protein
MYKAKIKVLGKLYNSEGKTALEAIEKLKPEGTPKGFSVLSISKGKTTKDKVLLGTVTFRLFNPNPTMRTTALKQVSSIFDGL